MIVVDTNLLVYLYVPTARTAQAEAVFQKDPLWRRKGARLLCLEEAVRNSALVPSVALTPLYTTFDLPERFG
jgi:hypothetical protein